jgi:hypothetical protein
MIALSVAPRKHIEQKRFNIVVKRFVVEEKLRQQAQILTINFVRVAIDFEDGNFAASIDLRARWISPRTFVEMTVEHKLAFRVLQAELAEKKFW